MRGNTVANPVLWRFIDAIVPDAWRSKQAKRIYDAAMEIERSGDWIKTAVGGSVRAATNKSHVPRLTEPTFGYRTPDESIETSMEHHINALRRHADRLENVMRCYGPGAFRSTVAAMRAPIHPFSAEDALLSVINGGYDEIWVHGVHFIKDASGSFVRAGD